jgi:hypothetical protein
MLEAHACFVVIRACATIRPATGKGGQRRAGDGASVRNFAFVTVFSLSFAVSMGEFGMVYPPGWVTLPVGIFALTDRGAIFDGAALTMLLVLGTLIVLVLLSRISERAATR